MTQAQECLDQKYPQNRENIKKIDLSGWNEKDWTAKLNWEKLTGELDLSEFPNLEKLDCSNNEINSLNLSNCSKLTELKCWENELTEIKFPSSQLNLKTFYAWNNYLTEIDWEKTFDLESLVKISLSNNNLQEQNIEIFSKFLNLEELQVGNDIEGKTKKNYFYGSLKFLKNLTKLRKLQIEGTDVEENFEYLSKDLQVVCWGKKEIIKQLDLNKEDKEKLLQAKNDFSEVLSEIISNYTRKRLGYNLTLGQEEQIKKLKLGNAIAIDGNFKELKKMLAEIKDGMIVSTIPSERLYVIRGNIKQFVKKWGKEEKNKSQKLGTLLNEMKSKGKEQENDKDSTKEIEKTEKKLTQEQNSWKKKVDNFFNEWIAKKRENKDNLNELSKLQSPEEINKNWWTSRKSIYTAQFAGRSAAVAGVVLTFWDYGAIGGGILGIYPFAELIVSNMEKSREDRKSKWDEFLADADNFLDNYNELLGILAKFKVEGTNEGIVDTVLKNLNDKIEEFLDVYDRNENREVEIDELIEKRDILFKDLRKEKNLLLSKSNTPTVSMVRSSLSLLDLKEEEITLCKIVDAIKELENAITEYRKVSYYGIIEEKNKETINSEKETNPLNQQDQQDEIQVQVEQPPKRGFTI